MSEIPKSIAKRDVVFIGLICRVIIFLLPFLLTNPGLRLDELPELVFILCPLTCLYFSLAIFYLIKYVFRNQHPLRQLSRGFVRAGYVILIGLHLIEITLITIRAFDRKPEHFQFFLSIAIAESLIASFSALSLAGLFLVKEDKK